MLGETGIACHVCADIADLVAELREGAGIAVVTEEGLAQRDLRPLRGWIEGQPEWSDFPFVLLIRRGGGLERNPAAARHLEVLGNVAFLERPFHPTTLVSLAKSAIRGRQRQYEARARLEALHESEARYRQIVEGAEDFAIVSLDEHGTIVSWNRGAERITRFAEAEAVGISGELIFTAEDRAAGVPAREMERARANGRAVNERWHVRKDGSRFWGSGLLMHQDRGGRGFLKIFRDRTIEHQADQAIQQLNETLEERVRARTAELEHAQEALRQSQKMEAMGTLTGGVAHDFNNLLTPIIGSLDLLHRRIDGERERRLIEGAMLSADRAKTLVQRLLAFARRQPLQARRVELAALLEGMAELVSRTSGPQVTVRLDVPGDLPPVHADPHQLEMAILNLAVNARDAMPSGGTLTIGAREVTVADRDDLASGRYIHLRVADTGIGMDEATLLRAIEPFFSTKGIGQGTGLGLSMVHGLAAQLGGAMRMDSAPGQGTRVDLWLPLSDEAAMPAAPEEAPASLDAAAPAAVLLVDDEPLIRMSTADMLTDRGFKVVEAGSGEAALEIVAQGFRPDILITDHLMPGLAGTDLADLLHEQLPHMPVLIISGYADLEGISPDIPRLLKPFREMDLVHKLDELLRT
ncbi:MAG: response regulator [Sphingomonadales bacterium]|nr:response regulator [Sphingomonadales bacterium]